MSERAQRMEAALRQIAGASDGVPVFRIANLARAALRTDAEEAAARCGDGCRGCVACRRESASSDREETKP